MKGATVKQESSVRCEPIDGIAMPAGRANKCPITTFKHFVIVTTIHSDRCTIKLPLWDF